MMSKILYLMRSTALSIWPPALKCPNCGSSKNETVDSKFIVTKLRRCEPCQMMFRTPTDGEAFNKLFYNLFYTEGTAMDLPSADDLQTLKDKNFSGVWADYSGYIDFIKRQDVPEGAKVFDFGCSWGYGSYQMRQAGFDVSSYEIGETRRNYGIENLGINHIDAPFDITPDMAAYESFDCFFSAHVLEHVPSPQKIFDMAWKYLKPGGVFIAFTPNGCLEYRKNHPQAWSNMWGGVHPNFLDDVFYTKAFPGNDTLFASRTGEDLYHQYELGFVTKKL